MARDGISHSRTWRRRLATAGVVACVLSIPLLIVTCAGASDACPPLIGYAAPLADECVSLARLELLERHVLLQWRSGVISTAQSRTLFYLIDRARGLRWKGDAASEVIEAANRAVQERWDRTEDEW